MDIYTSKKTSNSFVAYEVNGYVISTPLTSKNAGNCKWGFATKYNKHFFIKEFLSPKFPDKSADMYDSTRVKMIQQCEEWYSYHEKVYNAIKKCGASNIVSPLDFFLFKNSYYLITEKIESSGLNFNDICKKSNTQKDVILKVLAHEVSCLAEKNIVHSDLKPENLMLKYTVSDFFTVKIIDFDASFLEYDLPDPEDIVGDQVYYSPEMLLYIDEEDVKITCKSDVFALGILFHLILCGTTPKYDESFDCLGEAVLNGESPILSNTIPIFYRNLISDMLHYDDNLRISAKEVLCRLLDKDNHGVSDNSKSNNNIIINMK